MFGLATLASLFLAASSVSAHATFQDMWINGVDQAGKCVRTPQSNSPVTSVSTNVSIPTLHFLLRLTHRRVDPRVQREWQHSRGRQLRSHARR
jgi:hypothetical protein